MSDNCPVHKTARLMTAYEAADGHADSAVECGAVGCENLAILHAELADAYAEIASYEAAYGPPPSESR